MNCLSPCRFAYYVARGANRIGNCICGGNNTCGCGNTAGCGCGCGCGNTTLAANNGCNTCGCNTCGCR